MIELSPSQRLRRRACRNLAPVILLVSALLLAGKPADAATLPSGFGETTLGGTSGAPTAIDWAPDGRMFIAHKNGLVQVRQTNGTVSNLLDLSAKVNANSDRGLLGLAADRDFATNGYLYLLYVHELNPLNPDSPDPMASRLTRVVVKSNNTVESPASPETVILGTDSDQTCTVPNNSVDCIPADFYWHVIGTVRSDPSDGTLWVGAGDSHAPAVDAYSYRPYDPHSLAGKLIHIDRNGNGLPGHPFCPSDTDLSHVCTKIHASGLRNPYRFTLRQGSSPVVGDVGQSGYEELNFAAPGKNYGWPCYEGPAHTALYQSEARCQQEYAKEGTGAALTPPAWSYPTGNGGAIVAGPIYEGTNYPSSYEDKLFIADYVRGWVKALTIGPGDQILAEEPFATGMGPVVDLEPMPNGDLAYVNIGFGSSPAVRRITYANGNLAPDPVATATPTEGLAPLQVQFTGSGSTDPEDDDLSYEWDFGDGTANSTAPDPTHVYTGAGVFTARLTVDDGFNRFPNTTVTISVGGNKAPVPSISAPIDESKYRGGATVQLAGSATDDGPPSEVDLSWQVLLHHNTHLHEVATPEGAAAAFATYVDHDADSYYEVILTASDSEGGSATKRIQIRPETVDLTLASSPAGAPILYSGQGPFAAPTQRSAAVGYQATVEAPNLFVFDGRSYEFDGWSDGGGRKHVVSVPASDSTLTASYRRQVPPETTITAGPSALTSDARPAFAFASDDPAARFECGLDEGPYQPCTSPFQADPLGDGAHTFAVRATDPYVGTPDSTPSTRTFLVDSAAPHQARLRGSSPPSPANNNLPRVTGAAEAGSIVSLFGTRGCSGRPLASGAAAAFASRGLRIRVPSNALTKVRAVVTDPAGNRTHCSSDFVPYLEDSRRPRTRISAGPRGRTVDRTPTFWFRSDETGSRFRCRLDAGRWRHCGRQLTLRRPALGHHVLRVAAEDRAGNRGPVALRGFSVALRGKRDPTANSRLTIPLERRSGR